MNKKIIILIISLTGFLVLCGVSYWVYYLVIIKDYGIVNIFGAKQEGNAKQQEKPTSELPTQEEYLNKMATEFPDIIIGMLSFSSDGEATLKTSKGKIYTFTPNQPKDVYAVFGAKAGDNVQVQAKILDGNLIEWTRLSVVK